MSEIRVIRNDFVPALEHPRWESRADVRARWARQDAEAAQAAQASAPKPKAKRDYSEADRLQRAEFASAIQAAESEGRFVAVLVAWHGEYGYGRVIHGDKESIFVHSKQLVTAGSFSKGCFFRCKLVESSKYPDRRVAEEVELFCT